MSDDALRDQLRQLFSAELSEAVETLNAGLIRLEERVEDPGQSTTLIADLFRTAHSIKGAAMSAGVEAATAAARELERRLAAVRDGEETATPEVVQGLLGEVDRLAQVARDLSGSAAPPAVDPPTTAPTPPDLRTQVDQSPATVSTTPRDPQRVSSAPAGPSPRHQVRVPIGHIDELVNQVGELLAVANRAATIASWIGVANGHNGSPSEPRDTPRWDVVARSAASLARDLARVTGSLATGVERLTMQRFADACAGLERTVHDLARAAGKQARLSVQGGDVEVDRAVAVLLREPLLHLIRNAVDHGIEPSAERTAAGKPAAGAITITAQLRGGSLEVRVTDDGRGIDRTALRAAVLASPDPVIDADDELQLAFRPGITTATDLTDVSGRGLGLDVVRARLTAVGGTVQITSTAGEGTTVTLTCPVNLALLQALLLRIGPETIALPLTSVERVVKIPDAGLQQVGGQALVVLEEQPWPVVAVHATFNLPAPAAGYLVCCRVGADAAALAVDEVIEARELVIKPRPQRLEGLRELMGVTVLSDGRPAPVLNPAVAVAGVLQRGALPLPPGTAPAAPARTAKVLVAEDSLTTRVLQQRILEGAGYEVITAVDGLQALELLRRRGVDLVISDVDMPGMNGFELCQAIRRSPDFADIPVVLVTSLGSEQDRRRGVDAGADAYLVKSEFQADLLLQTVARLL